MFSFQRAGADEELFAKNIKLLLLHPKQKTTNFGTEKYQQNRGGGVAALGRRAFQPGDLKARMREMCDRNKKNEGKGYCHYDLPTLILKVQSSETDAEVVKRIKIYLTFQLMY